METKICTKCRKQLELNMFGKHKGTKDGLNCQCKECSNKISKKFTENNPEKTKESKKKYRDANVDKLKESKKKYHKKNLAKDSERVTKWRRENPDKAKAYSKSYNKKYNEENSDKLAEYDKNYYETNTDRISERHRKYNKEHLEMFRKYNQNRRAMKLLLVSTLTLEQWEKCKIHFNNKCCYCGEELPLAQEHYIAMSKSGTYSRNNILPSCKNCNSSKSNTKFELWYPKYKYYSKEREQIILEYIESVKEKLTPVI